MSRRPYMMFIKTREDGLVIPLLLWYLADNDTGIEVGSWKNKCQDYGKVL